MAAITDITWQQLQDAIGVTGAVTVTGTAPNETVMIDVSKVNGDTIQELTAAGVIECLAKLFYAARSAQTAANEGQANGERLNAFLQPTQAIQGDQTVLVTQQLQFKVPVNQNLSVVNGPNV